MQSGVGAVAQLRGRVADLRLEDDSKVFNTELITALELANMVEVAEVLAVSVLVQDIVRAVFVAGLDHAEKGPG